MNDKDKAEKLKQSLPPSLQKKEIDFGLAGRVCFGTVRREDGSAGVAGALR
eukprot:CAMPEP_0175292266 /NCGR_PEP_ID=MMETSP0093-20121207/56840_1 /TAXON_ID=311494 /ORGANISM="Alexandrium monilatum, Strain CCMP3105" /LENGTH=50 /DNA_ID=CAMNT_0016588057 /DNA_START=39 /DNA_END=189 /DNA_ORIENTATION=+